MIYPYTASIFDSDAYGVDTDNPESAYEIIDNSFPGGRSMRCWMCGTEDPDAFTPSRTDLICDRCMDALDEFFDAAFADMRVRYKAETGAEMWESEFIEGLQEYVDIKGTEFNRKNSRYHQHLVRDHEEKEEKK